MQRDRQLLFGVLAVQLTKLSPQSLFEVSAAWVADPSRDLADRLVESGKLTAGDRAFVDQAVDRALGAHGGDAAKSLAAAGGPEALSRSFGPSIASIAPESFVADVGGSPSPIEHPSSEGFRDDAANVTFEHPGRYSVKGEHGRGGIGRVLIAFDQHLGREVAVKELLTDGAEANASGSPQTPVGRTAKIAARFLREARITGQLEHPSIVPVYELGRRADGRLYYSMKLVRGRTLAKALEQAKDLRGRLGLLGHFVDLCQAVAYAHSRGVIHRDIKPQNVMVGEFGETVVLDWGLAKVRGKQDLRVEELERDVKLLKDAEAGKTVDGHAIGTPAYMSPEQAEGKIEEIDERSDVWSLGAVLYELLTGRPPYEGVTAFDTIGKVLKETAKPVREVNPEAPAELASVCAKALTRDKSKRYGSAADLAREVEAFQSGARVGAYAYSSWELLRRFVARNRAATAITASALVVLAGVVTTSYARVRTEYQGAVTAREIANEAKTTAMRNLSVAFSDKAARALADGDNQAAEAYAGAALSIEEQPEARGVVVGLSTRWRPTLVGSYTPPGGISGAWFFPGSKLVAITSASSNNIRLLRMGQLNQEVATIPNPDPPLRLVLSPDGQFLATSSGLTVSSSKEVVRVYNTRTATLVGQGRLGLFHAVGLAFRPDGRNLISGTVETGVIRWPASDPAQWTPLGLPGVPGMVWIWGTSPDGALMALSQGWPNGNAPREIFRLADDKRIATLPTTGAPVFSSDGRRVAVSRPSSIEVWDVFTAKRQTTFATAMGLDPIAYSSQRQLLAGCAPDSTVQLIDAARGVEIARLHGLSSACGTLAFDDDDAHLMAQDKASIVEWLVSQPPVDRPLHAHPTDSGTRSLRFSPGGNELAVTGTDGAISVWDLKSGSKTVALPSVHTGDTSFIGTWRADGTFTWRARRGTEPDGVFTWNHRNGTLNKSVAPFGTVVLALTDDGQLAFSAGGLDDINLGRVYRWPSGQLVGTIHFWNEEWDGEFTPDGKYLITHEKVKEKEEVLRVRNLPELAVVRTLPAGDRNAWLMAVSRDGRWVATSSEDGPRMTLWDLTTAMPSRELPAIHGPAASSAFSPDGTALAVGFEQPMISLFSTATGTELAQFRVPSAHVVLAFSPDGRHLVSGAARDPDLRIWDLTDLKTSGNILVDCTRRDLGIEVQDAKLVATRPSSPSPPAELPR